MVPKKQRSNLFRQGRFNLVSVPRSQLFRVRRLIYCFCSSQQNIYWLYIYNLDFANTVIFTYLIMMVVLFLSMNIEAASFSPITSNSTRYRYCCFLWTRRDFTFLEFFFLSHFELILNSLKNCFILIFGCYYDLKIKTNNNCYSTVF